MLDQLREGHIVVIWKLDQLARLLKNLVGLVNEIQEKGGSLRSLNDPIDTTSPLGKFTYHVFAALAEFERDILRERTKAGLSAARARGRVDGRPKGLSKQAQHRAIIAEKKHASGLSTAGRPSMSRPLQNLYQSVQYYPAS